METLQLNYRYAVLQWIDGEAKRVGIISANNYTHASKKAQQLFNRRVFVERL